MNFWASINSCNLAPAVTHVAPTVNDGTSVEKYTYSGGAADVVYYVVRGMGHAWPPNPSESADYETGLTSKNIDATKVIWDFFNQHSRIPREASAAAAPLPAVDLAKRRGRIRRRRAGASDDDQR